MKTMKHTQAGFTLLEVLIAIVLVSVGVIMVISMQTTALAGSRSAKENEQATTIARTEMEFQRARSVRAAVTNQNCGSVSGTSAFTCRVTITPCAYTAAATGAGTFACSATASTPVADTVAVTVSWLDKGKTNSVALHSLVRR